MPKNTEDSSIEFRKRKRMAHARAVREERVRKLREPSSRELQLRNEILDLKTQLDAKKSELDQEVAAKRARIAAPTIAVPEDIIDSWERSKFIARYKMRQIRARRVLEKTQMEVDLAVLEEAIERAGAHARAVEERDKLWHETNARVESLREERRVMSAAALQDDEREKELRNAIDEAPNDIALHDELGQLLARKSHRASRNSEITKELQQAQEFLELLCALSGDRVETA